MTIRPIAYVLADLTTSELRVVAEQVRRYDNDIWVWHLPDADRDVLRHACYALGAMPENG